MSTTENDFAHVKALGKSNYEIAEGDSDIRGWTVKNAQGNILGEVDDLLFDTEAKKVLYIVLDMDGNELNLRDRKVLVPVQVVELHEGYKNVILPGVMANELTALPTYEKGKLSTKTVDLVIHTFANVSPRSRESMPGAGGVNNSDTANTSYHASQAQRSYDAEQTHTRQSPVLPADTSTHQHDRSTRTDERHMDGDKHSDEVSKTVVGVFEHTNQAQAAIEYLTKYGFKRNNIDISNRNADEADNDEGITGFFRSLFKDDDDVYKYSEAAKAGAVVTVNTFSDKEAEEAAEILDQLGAINMDDRNVVRQKYNSRIILRQAPPIF